MTVTTPYAGDPLDLLPVPPGYFTWRGHRIARYQAGAGNPLLLIHSINAAASVFEMRAPFVDLAGAFHVHAIDLLGYGASDRPARRYQASDYRDLILATLDQIGTPTTIIASSLGAAYAVAAAATRPDQVRALVLICPTGISQLSQEPGPGAYGFYRILRSPFGYALFRLLTTRAGTRYFLRTQAYANPSFLTDPVVEAFYRTSHRPGAIYAPICFLSGLLNCRIADQFAALTQPVLLIWGRQATTTPLARADEFLARNRRAQLAVIDNASLLAQDEQPAACSAIIHDFLS